MASSGPTPMVAIHRPADAMLNTNGFSRGGAGWPTRCLVASSGAAIRLTTHPWLVLVSCA